jgi:hypothetical protein
MIVSPLEYEPELVSGLGLITVRWATLEHELAHLLGEFCKAENIGQAMYYGLGSFRQRLDVVQAAVNAGVVYPRHRQIANRLYERIVRLWKTRNKLVHSYYGYGNAQQNPSDVQTAGPPYRDGRTEIPGYFILGPDGISQKFCAVSPSTFDNHAKQLMKRTVQIRQIARAIHEERVRLMRPAARGYAKPRPRSPQARRSAQTTSRS